MKELWLEYKDDAGEAVRIQVDRDRFVIGRHSGCDLSIQNSIVSREHAAIDRFGEVFVISDCGSSYGTSVNGASLSDPVGLKGGDSIVLGGEFEIKIASDPEEETQVEEAVPVASPAPAEPQGSSIPTSFFFIAPIFGLMILLCAGGGLYIAYSGNAGDERTSKDEYNTVSDDDFGTPTPRASAENAATPEAGNTAIGGDDSEISANNPSSNIEVPSTPKPSTDSGKIEQISPGFLRKIVKNDPNAFLTGKQVEILVPKINQLKSSSALAANIKDARSNATQIAALAGSTNMTPQFLAAAALAKLGNQKGSVVETAKSMVEILEKLNRSIGVETADEALLVVAAFNQGSAGQFTQLRNQAEALSGKTQGVTARQVRTIWFLREQQKLSDAEFEFALRFLAIGTIAQKPSEFGVNAEALNL